MGKIHLRAEPSEINSENINSFCFDQVDRDELRSILSDKELFERMLEGDLSQRLQDRIINNFSLTPEQITKIFINSKSVNTSIIHHNYNIPAQVLKDHASKLPLYHIENQRNIDKEFFDLYRDSMDVSAFLGIRAERGDVLNFIDLTKDRDRISSFVRYDTDRDSVLNVFKQIYSIINGKSIIEVMDRYYMRTIDAEVLAADYDNNRSMASHSTRDMVNYYRNNNKTRYSNWEEYVADAKTCGVYAVARVWFDDIILNLMLSEIEAL